LIVEVEYKKQYDIDKPVIESIIKALKSGNVTRKQIIDFIDNQHSIKKIDAVLDRYEGMAPPEKLWTVSIGARNIKTYILLVCNKTEN
jgi:hypothetical protein